MAHRALWKSFERISCSKESFPVWGRILYWIKKKKWERLLSFPLYVCQQLAVSAHLSEALAAEHGTVGLGLEGNPATCAGSGEELRGATGNVLASVTASLAALGLVLEAALCVELLLTSGEHELVAALFAN